MLKSSEILKIFKNNTDNINNKSEGRVERMYNS